jgi:hypothetical protein
MIATHLKNIKLLKARQDIGLTVTLGICLNVVMQYRLKAIAKLKSRKELREK